MRHLLLILTLCLTTLAPAMAATPSQAVEDAVQDFEDDLERAFQNGRKDLDRFRADHARNAARVLWATGSEAAGDDRLWVAWHVLALDPRHGPAAASFRDAGLPVPVDDGWAFAPSAPPPAPADTALVELVADAMHPPQAELIAVAQEAMKSYMRRNTSATKRFVRELAGIRRDGYALLVDPVLAFYFPKEAAAKGIQAAIERPAWINPLDRYLLQHGLLAIGLGETPPTVGRPPRLVGDHLEAKDDAAWHFPIPLAHWRMELVTSEGSRGTASVLYEGDQGLAVSWRPGAIVVAGPGVDAGVELAAGRHFVQLLVTGNQWVLVVDGAQAAGGELDRQAWLQAKVHAGSTAAALRVRYYGSGNQALLAAAGAPPAPQAVLPPSADEAGGGWKARLETQLDEPVTFAFTDMPLNEVVAALDGLHPANWRLDASALALGDLPMTLAAEGMTGKQALAWFKRMAGLDHELTPEGIVLVWN